MSTKVKVSITFWYDENEPSNKGWVADTKVWFMQDSEWVEEEFNDTPMKARRVDVQVDTLRKEYFRTAGGTLAQFRRAFVNAHWQPLESCRGWRATLTKDIKS